MRADLTYGSVCSGIEAATVAWEPLGWKPAFFCEIEPFPCALLQHYYPDVPNLGDMLKADWAAWTGKIDVLVGGTPCQAFSVAGLRKSLDDERGNLTLEFARAADIIRPRYLVWENVPGVLSTTDNAFGCFLGALVGADAALETEDGKWPDAGMVCGPSGRCAWRILDAQFFGLAQRRRRVFLVRCPRDGADPGEVLFERPRLLGHPPAHGEAGQRVAPTLEGRAGRSGANNFATSGGLACAEVAGTLPSRTSAGGGLGTDFDLGGGRSTVPALTNSGRGVSRCGESRGQDPVIPVRK